MKASCLLVVATLFTSVAVLGQGEFIFNNRAGFVDVNARFVLATDPPGTSSVGTNFRVDLSGGPEGTPLTELVPLNPPSTGFRGPAGSIFAGYVVAMTPTVTGVKMGGYATVLIRVFDGSSWDDATYRFERLYPRVLLGGDPVMAPFLLMGKDPLVLLPVPEPKSVVLVLVALGPLACGLRRRLGAMLTLTLLAAPVGAHGQGQFHFNNRIGDEVDARFVLSTDPPGTSSVGTDFQVQLFAGPEGTPVIELLPTNPPSTGFRGPAGTPLAGYVTGAIAAVVPPLPYGASAVVVIRVLDGENWDAATFRLEREYHVSSLGGLQVPPYLTLGTSPLVLYPVPEPATVFLALVSLIFVIFRTRNHVRVPLSHPTGPWP